MLRLMGVSAPSLHRQSTDSLIYIYVYKINTHSNTGGNRFSPWEDFFVNPFGSYFFSPNQLCTCILVQVLIEAHVVEQ